MEISPLKRLPSTFSAFFLLLHLTLFGFGLYTHFILSSSFGLKILFIGILGTVIGATMYYFVDAWMREKTDLETQTLPYLIKDDIKKVFNEYLGYWAVAICFYIGILIIILIL